MKKLILIGCLLLAGCVKGDKGDTGIQGLRGPGSIEMLKGSIASNDFYIFDPKIAAAKQITVYVSDGSQILELPYYLPLSATNVYAMTTQSFGRIEIYNGMLAGATSYLIVLIL